MSSTEKELKPAILAKTGTTASISMIERPQPQAKKPSIDLAQAKKRAAARELKLKQEVRRKQMAEAAQAQRVVDAEDRAPSDTSSTSIRSVYWRVN